MMDNQRDYGDMFIVTVPEDCIGSVLGEIASRGGFIEAMSVEGDQGAIHARLHEGEFVLFEAWLNTTPGITGKVAPAEPANDHHA